MTVIDAIKAEKQDIDQLVLEMGSAAKAAARVLASAPTDQKNKALMAAAATLRSARSDILAANAKDVNAAAERNLTPAMLDRLKLDDARLEGIATGLEEVAALADPVGAVLSEWDRPNGLHIARVAVPLGVIGIIYESRPMTRTCHPTNMT